MIKLELTDGAAHSMGPLEMMVLSTTVPRPMVARLEDKIGDRCFYRDT